METQERPKATAKSLKDLLDKLAWQKESEALFDAFIEALEAIPDRAIKSETCMNTVRHAATKNATARTRVESSDDEVAGLFEEECKRFSAEMLEMPGQFRTWLKANPKANRVTEPRATGASRDTRTAIIDILIGIGESGGPVCDCERCVAFRASVG